MNSSSATSGQARKGDRDYLTSIVPADGHPLTEAEQPQTGGGERVRAERDLAPVVQQQRAVVGLFVEARDSPLHETKP